MRARDEALPLPTLAVKGSLAERGQAVLSELAAGSLSPSEASSLLSALSAQAKLIEMDELERRIADLEARRDGHRA